MTFTEQETESHPQTWGWLSGDLQLITDAIPQGAKGQPEFQVSDVSKFFFGKPPHWLRWQEKMGHLVDPVESRTGDPDAIIGRRNTNRKSRKGDIRVYSLRDIEILIRQLHSIEALSESLAEIALSGVEQQTNLFLSRFDQSYMVGGIDYSLSVSDVATEANKSTAWVRAHAASLGGVLRSWSEGSVQKSWRFHQEGLEDRISAVVTQGAINRSRKSKTDSSVEESPEWNA